jgi:hypothetical protein
MFRVSGVRRRSTTSEVAFWKRERLLARETKNDALFSRDEPKPSDAGLTFFALSRW